MKVLVAWYCRDEPPSIRYDASVKGAPANPISGVVVPMRAMHQLDRVANKAERGHIDVGNPLEVGFGANRTIDYWPVTFLEMQPDFHRDQRQQDVGENDSRVHLEPLDRQ